MSDRVTRLETHFEYVQRDLGEIMSDLKTLTATLVETNKHISDLPTKSDLWSWKIQYTGLCIAAIALIVGGIIGGLSWIKPDSPSPAAPSPIVINVPQAPAASIIPAPAQK